MSTRFLGALLLLLVMLSSVGAQQTGLIIAQHPLNQGLLAWWRGVSGLTGAGTVWDLAGCTPLAITGMTSTTGWFPTSRPSGQQQLTFDGTAVYATTPIPARFNQAQGSLASWARRTTAAVSQDGSRVTGRKGLPKMQRRRCATSPQ